MYNSEPKGSTENFVIFGTAFPETTDKDRRAGRSDAGQFVPLWKQEARDEKGRRRFHGAFTGGFSAGYFNTVGSKEGWEPSNYVSSRNARNERKEARPEDFMDEEDLQACSRKLVATEEFDILGGTERELANRRKQQQQEDEKRGSELSFIGSSLVDMLGPPRDSVGVRLLRKMGWRPGQGVGPRMIKRPREESEDEDEDDAFIKDITFAPRDTPIENFQIKKDTYGLGYDISTSVPEIAEMKRLRELAKKKEAEDDKKRSSFGVFNSSRSSDAFGLGAFEDEGDDEDVYGDRGMKGYNRVLYEDEGGMTRDELKAQERKRKREKEEDYRREASKSKCSDGRLPLKGFSVSNQKQQIGKWYPPPVVPADFTGHHASKEDDIKPSNITKESIFSFEERGMVLGEKPIEQRSVFDYMPKRSKDKLDETLRFFVDSGKDKTQLADFPSVPKDVALLALKGFMPFGDNPKKQGRYRSYLENHAGMLTEDGVPKKVLPIPEGLVYEAAMKEMDEFAKAARIFRPISAMMSSRFTSASEASKNIEVTSFEGGLKTEEQYRKEKEEKAKTVPEPEKKQPTQEAEAAAMKMFGALTRTIKPFYPSRLVCKRFNIPNPHPNSGTTTDVNAGRSLAGSKEALSKEAMESILNERMPLKFTSSSVEASSDDPLLKSVIPKPSERAPSDDSKAPTTGIEEKQNVDQQENDEQYDGKELDYERPSMDIFKAIFDDSEEEEEGEEEEEEKGEEKDIKPGKTSAAADDSDDSFIGPVPPPKAPTADIPIEANKSLETTEVFRPMFKRPLERQEQNAALTNIVSEEVVVQPFKPRSTASKRRRVSVLDEEDERNKDRKALSEDKYRHKSHYGSSRKRSKSPDSRHSSSRKRSRSRERKHKSSRKRSKSREGKIKKSKSEKHRSHKHKRKDHTEDEFEGMWVEKEPVLSYNSTDNYDNRKREGRLRAADLWS
ncbi:hypothetical protein G6F42_007530 [Rhizopus arrhizus]|nr:hypothetical protein G6F42_007530 [Rhizopus arrhizus]